MQLDVARVDILTTRIYHLRRPAQVQVYSGRGKGPQTVDVQAVRQVVDTRGHETTEAYVSDGPAGEWRLLTPGSEHVFLEALIRTGWPDRLR